MEDSMETEGSTKALLSKQRPSVQDPATSSRASSVGSWRHPFRSGGTCPTCNGTGRIPHGQDDELVALIPYSDKRLKPRRRWCLYLATLLLVVLVCGCVLLAFMFPRSASLKLTAMNSTKTLIPLDNHTSVSVPMETHIHIKNDNFFRLEVKWLQITLYNANTKVGNSKHTSLSIRAREDATAVVSQNATFTDTLANRVRTLCTGKDWKHCLYMQAEAEMQYTVLSHTAETITSDYFFVSCDFLEESDWTDTSSCE